MSKEVGKLSDMRPAGRASCLEINKRLDRDRAAIFRIPRRDRMPSSPMAVRFTAIHHKAHIVLCSKGLKLSEARRAYRLASYRNLSEKANIQLLQESILADNKLTTLKVCLRLSPDMEERLFFDSDLSYIRDEVRKAIRTILPDEHVLFYLVKEISPGVPPHFHGAMAVPKHLMSDTLLNQLTESIRNRAPFRHYRQYWNNYAVDIGATYKRNKGTGEEKPIDSGCASYALKNTIGKIHWVGSAELKQKGRRFYDDMQRRDS